MPILILVGLGLILLGLQTKTGQDVIKEGENLILSIRNNNPGNLIYDSSINWTGQIGKDSLSKFAKFDSPLTGTRANCINAIAKFNEGATDFFSFGDMWAPIEDNPGSKSGDYGKELVDYINGKWGTGVTLTSTPDYKSENGLAHLMEAITDNEEGPLAVAYFQSSFQQGALEALQEKGLA